MVDSAVLDLYEAMVVQMREQGQGDLAGEIALVPHGGYGRRDVAPYSDADVMLLYHRGVRKRIQPFVRKFVGELWSAGVEPGFNPRTPADACSLALGDPKVFTSLVESRFLAGSVKVYRRFISRLRRGTRGRRGRLIEAIIAARRAERNQYGGTVYLLEPNVKRSPGTLRDLQLLRWVGFARYGESDPGFLRSAGVLTGTDFARLLEATEFLLRLRNELHFQAGRSYDLLDKPEQLRIAEQFGCEGRVGGLPVEQLMQDYFRHTSEVRHVVSNFVACAKPRSFVTRVFSPLFRHRMEKYYCVGRVHIVPTREGLLRLQTDVSEVLRLLDLANLYDKWIDSQAWHEIRTAMAETDQVDLTEETRRRFLSIMSQPTRLGDILRRLHELRVLEKIIPGMGHARCLLQFNEYHKYTVDEHCIRAVECATRFQNDDGTLGEAYRSIRRKRTLHLALLLHDMGKGFLEDHSEVGRRLAEETAQVFQLGKRESEKLVMLVYQHLKMTHLAFRRDTSDETLVVQFAVEVGSPDALKMLYVLACADMAAVGPGVLNAWKVEVLTELYVRAMRYLAGDAPSERTEGWLSQKREAVRTCIHRSRDQQWFEQHIAVLPSAYLRWSTPEQIAEELTRLQKLTPAMADAWGFYLADHKAMQYTIGAYEQLIPGIFHKLTGALASHGQQILSAEIYTLDGGLALDRFYVHDREFSGEPPISRQRAIRKALVSSLVDSQQVPSFRPTWDEDVRAASVRSAAKPTHIQFDNSTSDRYTIIDVFAHDRLGLLYTVTRKLFELRLSVAVAKIGTHTDQVVDVFYVTGPRGQKIENEDRLDAIKLQLEQAISEQMAD